MQREDRLKSFPKRLKLPRDALIECPVDHQLQSDGTRGGEVRAVYSGYIKVDVCQVIQSPTLRYSSRLWMVTGTSLPPFFNSMFGNPGRVKSRPRSSTEQPFMLRLSKACCRVSRVWQIQTVTVQYKNSPDVGWLWAFHVSVCYIELVASAHMWSVLLYSLLLADDVLQVLDGFGDARINVDQVMRADRGLVPQHPLIEWQT